MYWKAENYYLFTKVAMASIWETLTVIVENRISITAMRPAGTKKRLRDGDRMKDVQTYEKKERA